MQRGYIGGHMTTYGYLLPGSGRLARASERTVGLSKAAKHRLKILNWHSEHGLNQSLTARHFGVDREALREWLVRLNRFGPIGLNDRSKRPERVRQPTTPTEVITAVMKLRRQYPAWGKEKLHALLAEQGIHPSVSTVGRLLSRQGLIPEKASRKRQRAALYPKQRFPRGFLISAPGDLVQLDTKHLTVIGGKKLYQFTAIDVLTKLRVLDVSTSISSQQAARFLNLCLQSFPFPMKAIQTDNGREFMKYFHQACERMGIPHYWTEPRSPKQNSYVERSHLTDEKEFYQLGNLAFTVADQKQLLQAWQAVYNTVRPHKSLGNLTPAAYFRRYQQTTRNHPQTIVLQT